MRNSNSSKRKLVERLARKVRPVTSITGPPVQQIYGPQPGKRESPGLPDNLFGSGHTKKQITNIRTPGRRGSNSKNNVISEEAAKTKFESSWKKPAKGYEQSNEEYQKDLDSFYEERGDRGRKLIQQNQGKGWQHKLYGDVENYKQTNRQFRGTGAKLEKIAGNKESTTAALAAELDIAKKAVLQKRLDTLNSTEAKVTKRREALHETVAENKTKFKQAAESAYVKKASNPKQVIKGEVVRSSTPRPSKVVTAIKKKTGAIKNSERMPPYGSHRSKKRIQRLFRHYQNRIPGSGHYLPSRSETRR